MRVEAKHVRLEFANGASERAGLVVGADGIRSVVRGHVTDGDNTIFPGTTGLRGLFPRERVPNLPDPEALQFWVGPGAPLLYYPTGSRAEFINILAVVEGPARWPNSERWRDEVYGEDVARRFAGWHPAAMELCQAVAPREAGGMLPHQGQGANQTIADAVTLAAIIANPPANRVAESLLLYESLRKPRTPARADPGDPQPGRRGGAGCQRRSVGFTNTMPNFRYGQFRECKRKHSRNCRFRYLAQEVDTDRTDSGRKAFSPPRFITVPVNWTV